MKLYAVFAFFFVVPGIGTASTDGIKVEWIVGDLKEGKVKIKTWPARGSEIEAIIKDGYLSGEFSYRDADETIQGKSLQGLITSAEVTSAHWQGRILNGNPLKSSSQSQTAPSVEGYPDQTSSYNGFGEAYQQKEVKRCERPSDHEGLNQIYLPHAPLVREDYFCKDGMMHGLWRKFDIEGFLDQELNLQDGWLEGRQRFFYHRYQTQEVYFAKGRQSSPAYDHWEQTARWDYVMPILHDFKFTSIIRQSFSSRVAAFAKALSRDADSQHFTVLLLGYDSLQQGVLGFERMGMGRGGHIGCVMCSNKGLRLSLMSGIKEQKGAELNTYLGMNGVLVLRLAGGIRYQSDLGGAVQPSFELGIYSTVLSLKLPYYFAAGRLRPEASLQVGFNIP